MLGLPNLAQRSKAGIWRNPLAFPTGRRPGFDPNHVAVGNNNGTAILGSYIPLGNNFVNILSGAALNINSGPLVGGQTQNGPGITFTGTQNASVSVAAVTPTRVTLGCIISLTSAVSQSFTFIGFNSSSMFYNSAGHIDLFMSSDISSGLSLPLGNHFVACSAISGGNCLFVTTNLSNGKIRTSTVAGSTLAASTLILIGNNGPSNGNGSPSKFGYTAAAMASQSYLSLAQLLAWAQDPWSFWYPDPFNFDYVGAASVFAVTALFGSRIELLGSSKASLASPTANDAGLSAIPASKIELGAAFARAATISAETPAGVATRASTPAELAGAVAAIRLAPAEAKAAVAVARAAMAESIAAVTGVTRVAAEVSLAALGLARAAIESAAGSQGALRLDVESLGTLSALARVNLELVSSATSAVLAQSLIALEWLGGVQADFGADLEWAQFPLHPDPRFVIQVARRLLAAAISRRVSAATISARVTASYLRLPMPQGPDFSEMDVGETVTLAIDFARWLQAGETIRSISSVALVNYDPEGGAAYLTAVGSPGVGTAPLSMGGSGTVNAAVLQAVQGANPGAARMTATIATSLGNVYVGWAHQPVGTPD